MADRVDRSELTMILDLPRDVSRREACAGTLALVQPVRNRLNARIPMAPLVGKEYCDNVSL